MGVRGQISPRRHCNVSSTYRNLRACSPSVRVTHVLPNECRDQCWEIESCRIVSRLTVRPGAVAPASWGIATTDPGTYAVIAEKEQKDPSNIAQDSPICGGTRFRSGALRKRVFSVISAPTHASKERYCCRPAHLETSSPSQWLHSGNLKKQQFGGARRRMPICRDCWATGWSKVPHGIKEPRTCENQRPRQCRNTEATMRHSS
jgi:hypothetical protein